MWGIRHDPDKTGLKRSHMPQIHMITNGIPPCAGCLAHEPVVDPYHDPSVITALIGADLEGMPRQQEETEAADRYGRGAHPGGAVQGDRQDIRENRRDAQGDVEDRGHAGRDAQGHRGGPLRHRRGWGV